MVSSSHILKQASRQNPAVAFSLNKLRARSMLEQQSRQTAVSSPLDSSYKGELSLEINLLKDSLVCKAKRPSALGPVILLIGIIILGFVIGPKIYRIIANYWSTIFIALGSCLIGAGIILLITQFDKNPLKNVIPPDANTENPLAELEKLANRSVARLKTAYHLQIYLIIFVALILAAVLFWSIVMITRDKILYATAFSSSGVGMLILSKWKWQPFERVTEARKLADDADILATGLRIRMQSIMAITDPKERAQAQWTAVSDYLAHS